MPYKTGTWGEQAKQRSELRWVTRREQALEILGHVCANCGFSDPRALQIDHIDGGGSLERRLKGTGNWFTINQILAGNTEKYQLLCANCNWIKRFENREHYRRDE